MDYLESRLTESDCNAALFAIKRARTTKMGFNGKGSLDILERHIKEMLLQIYNEVK